MDKEQISYFRESVEKQSEICDGLLIAKQQDYGPGNITKFGEFGVLVRATDKLERLTNLIENNKEPQNERVEDTWRDLRNYAQIALMLREGEFELPLRGDE